MTSLKLVDRAMYSALVVDMAVIVCILDVQVMDAPAKRTIQPDRDLDESGVRRTSPNPPNNQSASPYCGV